MDYINGMILKSIYRIFFHQLEFKHGSSLIRIISVRIFSSIPFIFPAGLKFSIKFSNIPLFIIIAFSSPINVTVRDEFEAETITKKFAFREIYT